MPCVFPILSLKILGFVEKADQEPRKIKLHGLIFTLGILLSFWALSGLLLALRAGGKEFGWGFQLQSPAFLVFLACLLMLLALSFSGIFEIGTSAIGIGAKLTQKSGYTGSFWSGVLATLLATPCTAPFMGTALGFALTQPAYFSLSVFTMLALGMATPYLILSSFPALIHRLPKPGPWMESFKQAMAFPLLATVLWLLWVFDQQTSSNALFILLFGLLLIACAAWIYGKFSSRVSLILASLFFISGAAFCYEAATSPYIEQGSTMLDEELSWETFSPQFLEQLRSQGKHIYIDFTASWCLTCQVNKLNVFKNDAVIKALKEKKVVLLKADWTRRDPVITKALETYGRSGVPTNVIYPPRKNAQPIVLPELLTPSIVLEALNKD